MVNELSLLNQGQRTEQRVSYELISNINGNVNRNFTSRKRVLSYYAKRDDVTRDAS